MVTVDEKGLKQMKKILQNFPINVRKNAIKGMVRAGAKVIEEEAKRLVPVDTGNLRESISTISQNSKDKNIAHYAVTPLKNKSKTKRFISSNGTKWSIKGQVADGYYAHMIEFGTSKMKAQPFLRPAESKHSEAYDESKKYLAKRVNKLIRMSK